MYEQKIPKIKFKKTPQVIDLCSGMGGISLAAQQLGMNVLAGLDIEPSASRTFKHNFPYALTLTGSVRSTKLQYESKQRSKTGTKGGKPLIVVSGPPCQGFSIAGPRDPNDTRNQILVAVARFIAEINPRCALVENVARILDPKHAIRVAKFKSVLTQSGFHVLEIIVNAEEYGVAQRRKRAFFMISRRQIKESCVVEKFEIRKKKRINVKDVLSDLPVPLPRPDFYTENADDVALTNHFAMQHSALVKRKIALIPQGKGPMSYRKLDPTRPSNTLISGNRAPPAHYDQPRSITVREALRIQGFPDDFRVYGGFGSQMGQVTNAVPPPLARAALEVLCEITGLTSDH